MVKPIPREHKGLYLSVPFTHGRQSNIAEDTHNEARRDTPLKPRAKCFTTQTVEEYKPDIKTNLMSGKIEGEKEKMIYGFVKREEFDKLTEAEAKAFILFLTMEARRHAEDIMTIEEDISYVKRMHEL